MARKIRQESNVEVIDIADKGMSVGKTPEGEIVMLRDALPGQIVEAELYRKRKGVRQGKAIAVTEESPWRVDAKCKHFGVCGGCKWQHLDYAQQLVFKDSLVRNALTRIGKVDLTDKVKDILGCEDQYRYRNKLEFTFSDKRWLTEEEIGLSDKYEDRSGLGFHRPGAFDKVVDISECWLIHEEVDEYRNYARQLAKELNLEFFNIRKQSGLLRTMMIRRTSIGQLMIVFSFFEDREEDIDLFLSQYLHRFPNITCLQYCINPKGNDTILDLEMRTVKGSGFIEERLDDLKFEIGAKSFFQVNTHQAVRLYDLVRAGADLKATDVLYDLYSGTGSIGLYLARSVKQVVGVETVPEAVEDARRNQLMNDISNADFVEGDTGDTLKPSFVEKYGRPNVLVTDPPRAGMDKKVVAYLLDLGCPKIVYVSCNPSTQARDILLLSEKYELVSSQAVDMFPHTSHVENVVVLKLKSQHQ